MPVRRPAPLSDEVFNATRAAQLAAQQASAAAATPASAVNAATLGYTVKNTFIDVPSGLTPSNMQVGAKYQALMTAPPDLNHAPGRLQRALLSSSGAAPSPVLAPVPPSPLNTAGTSSYGTMPPVTKRFSQTPLATASPSAALGFSQWASGVAAGTAPGQAVYAAPMAAPLAAPPGTFGTAPAAAPPAYSAAPPAYSALAAPHQQQPYPGFVPMHCPGQPLQVFPDSPVRPRQQATLAGATAEGGQQVPLQQQQQNDPDDEEDSDDDGIVAPHLRNMKDAPKPPEGALHPSLGSEGHEEGTCKRCCFFPRGRCTNGYNCEFCHYEHDKRKRKNKKKKKKESAATTTGTTAAHVPYGGSLQQMQPPPMVLGMPAPVVHATQPSSPVLQQAPPLSTAPTVAPAMGHYMVFPPSPDRSAQHQQLQQQPQPVLVPGHGYQMHPQASLGLGTPPPQPAQQQMPLPQPAPHHHVIYGPTHVPTCGTQPQALQGFMIPPQQQQPQPQLSSAPTGPCGSQVGLAPPIYAPSLAAPVVEATPPPPMLSPKFGQVGMMGRDVPPPMVSPKLPRQMLPAM